MMNQGKIPVLYAGKYSMYVNYKNSVVTAHVMDDQSLIPKIGRNMNNSSIKPLTMLTCFGLMRLFISPELQRSYLHQCGSLKSHIKISLNGPHFESPENIHVNMIMQ